MKIIFDSEEQRQTFLDENCPQHFGFPKPNYHQCDDMNCDECLSKYIEMEVKAVEQMNKLQYTAISADEDGNTNHKVTITAEFNESIGENAAVELVGKALAMFLNEVRMKNNERAD